MLGRIFFSAIAHVDSIQRAQPRSWPVARLRPKEATARRKLPVSVLYGVYTVMTV